METEIKPFNEPKAKVRNFKQLNEWLFEDTESGNYVVKTKEGDFEFTDVPYERVMGAKRRATRGDGQTPDVDIFELGLITESLVTPKIGELDLKKLKSSTVFKLRAAIYKMYDINSFLSM